MRLVVGVREAVKVMKGKFTFSYILFLSVFLACLYSPVSCNSQLGSTVIGIDFGSHFIKISYVAPNEPEPLPIMLNDISERKTLNAVAFKNGQVYLGPHAVKPLLNSPDRGYSWLNNMLGKKFDDPVVLEHLSYTTAEYSQDHQTGTIIAKTFADETAPVEYLLSLLLTKLMEQTAADANKVIREAVITVPPYFGQAQRQAVLNVAAMAGLRVSSLANDVSAAGLYYGTFSMMKETEPRNVIIFDSGATHTSAAVVHIQPKHDHNGRKVVLVEVKAVVSDTNLNGLALDRAAARILAKKFSEANNGKIVPLGKAFNRLLAEANKVKQILSANSEIRVNIEELVDDLNLSTKVSRAELEEECASLKGSASALVNKLMEEAKMGHDLITSIIPIGGNSRVPFVQDDLKKVFGDRVQFTLNMDECTAQGAAWYAATLAGFRVKETRFVDVYPNAISLDYSSPSGSDTEPSHLSIYNHQSPADGHKGIAFKNMESLDFVVHSDLDDKLLSGKIEGMSVALGSLGQKTILSSKLKFWIDLNTSGMVDMRDTPVALVEYETQELKKVAPPAAAENGTTTEEALPVDNVVPEWETIQKTELIPLKYSVDKWWYSLSEESIKHGLENIKKLKDAERAATRKASARNSLEENLYRLRDRIEESHFQDISQEQERASLTEFLGRASQILDEDDEKHDVLEYEQLLSNIVGVERGIDYRVSENKRRPTLFNKLRESVKSVSDYVQKIRVEFPDASKRAQSDKDLESLDLKQGDSSVWLNDMEARQSKIAPNGDSIVTCNMIQERIDELNRLQKTISMKKLPPPPKEKPVVEVNKNGTVVEEENVFVEKSSEEPIVEKSTSNGNNEEKNNSDSTTPLDEQDVKTVAQEEEQWKEEL